MGKQTPKRHILLISSARSGGMTGADRDWITLTNSFQSSEVRISWVVGKGGKEISPLLNRRIAERIVEVDFPLFHYLLHQNAHQKRSLWLWTKIIADHLLRLVQPLRQLHRAFKDDPVDLVISNTALVTIGALYAKIHRLPHVWCVKECLDNVPACRKFARWITRLSSAVVVPSLAVAESFPCPVQVFHDGNDVIGIRASAASKSREQVIEQLQLTSARPLVVQIGGVVWWKGQHVMAQAFTKLAAEGGDPSFSLLFLGNASPNYKEELDQIVKQAPNQWQEAVRFIHFNPNDFSFLGAADIVVHPSVLPDPFPNAVREAMILGKPVIASRNGGIPEMIEDGEAGILFQTGNSDELAAALKRLLASPQERLRLGDAAKTFATVEFDIHLRKQSFYQLMQKLTNGSPGGKVANLSGAVERIQDP